MQLVVGPEHCLQGIWQSVVNSIPEKVSMGLEPESKVWMTVVPAVGILGVLK